MSKYQFAGTIKEIVVEKSNVVLKIIPDKEYVSLHKNDKINTTYALLQPDYDKGIGWVFKYSEYVYLEVSKGAPCHHLTVNLHCSLTLDTTLDSGMCDVTFSDIQKCTTSPVYQFAITSVRAL